MNLLEALISMLFRKVMLPKRMICKGKGNEAGTILHCDECDYQTTKKYNLKRHKEKHSWIICDGCGKSFTTLLKLDKHKSRVHPVKYYHCEHCEFKSTKKWIRNRHQELNHDKSYVKGNTTGVVENLLGKYYWKLLAPAVCVCFPCILVIQLLLTSST